MSQPIPAVVTRLCPIAPAQLPDNFTPDDLYQATISHIKGLRQCLAWLQCQLEVRIGRHDEDKLRGIHEFYQYLSAYLNKQSTNDWYEKHTQNARHHLPDRVPDDVNLIDVLEYLFDCVTAGRARGGEYYPPKLPADVLVRAFENTAAQLNDAVVVRFTDEDDKNG